jgi:hypothetical protein
VKIKTIEQYPCLCCGEQRAVVEFYNGETMYMRADQVRALAPGDIVEFEGGRLTYKGRDD